MRNSQPALRRNLLSPAQELLLKAALLPAAESHQAGLAWLESVNLDEIQRAENRLFPLVYERLRSAGVEHPLMPVLKGLKRYSWYWNQILFAEGKLTVEALQQAGVDVMLIKGAALAHGYYEDPALRSMNDLDVLVRTQDAAKAVQVLTGRGLSPQYDHKVARFQIQYAHAMHFYGKSKRDVDLHWHLLNQCVEQGADDAFWAASEELDFLGRRVRTLCAADQLLHACVHGVPWSSAPLQWIADAVTILRKAPGLDWDRLVSAARESELTVMVREALSYINQEFAAPVPASVLRELTGGRQQRRLEREYRVMSESRPGLWLPLEHMLRHYDRVSRMTKRRAGQSSFPDFLCAYWAVGTRRELPLLAWRKVSEKLFQREERSNSFQTMEAPAAL